MRHKRQSDAIIEPILRSRAMREVDRVLRAVAPRDVSICLVGETGSGKEVLARRIHALSSRRSGPFVPINCAAIPEALFESELFGHERGAFTGAGQRNKGKVEAAEGGTLFLDELAELPLAMQSKLLRFLENRRFMRVGGTSKIHADVRLLFATSRALEEELRAGRLRADLYYRVQGVTVRVPPLRERRADLVPLMEGLLAGASTDLGLAPPKIGREARALLLAYPWPGNVRELRNVIETLCLLRPGRRVRSADLPDAVFASTSTTRVEAEGENGTITIELAQPLDLSIACIIEAVLTRCQGDTKQAAAALGISLRTLQRRLASGAVRRPVNASTTRSRARRRATPA